MAGSEPFNQLTGTQQIYIAPVGEAVPAVNVTPAGNWYLLGATDGEQKLTHGGELTTFRDNDHQGPVKAVRPEEDDTFEFTVVNLSLENYSRILDRAADIVTVVGPPATKKIPLKRGAIPDEYAMLFRGSAMSPYGALPGMYVVPRGVFDGEPSPTWAKDGRPGLAVTFRALEDDDQADADRMGWLIVQTA